MRKIAYLLTVITVLLLTGHSVNAETYSTTFTKEGKTYVQTKTISGSSVTIETKIYDAEGNLIDTKTVVKEANPTPIKEVVYPTKTITPTSPTKTATVTPAPKTQVKEDETATQKTEATVDTFVVSKFPLYLNEDTGNIMVKSGSQDVELKVKPEAIVTKAQTAGIKIVSEVSLEENGDKLNYVVKGLKVQKLFAVIEVPLNTTLYYNTQSGALEKTQQSRWVKLADIFSF